MDCKYNLYHGSSSLCQSTEYAVKASRLALLYCALNTGAMSERPKGPSGRYTGNTSKEYAAIYTGCPLGGAFLSGLPPLL